MLDQITPIILTYNEATNIRRTLEPLRWARDIVVVDSFSDDDTLTILAEFPQVRVFQRRFNTHQRQWNYALEETGINSEWVLALDADYVLTPELVEEIKVLQPPAIVAGYQGKFVYCVHGRPLRGSAYPPVTVLYRRAHAAYRQDGHTQRVVIDGDVQELRFPILHDDRKPLSQWLCAQDGYTQLELQHLRTAESFSVPDRLRKNRWLFPFAIFFYCLFVKGAILDGWAGIHYAFQRMLAEILLALYLIEEDFAGKRESREAGTLDSRERGAASEGQRGKGKVIGHRSAQQRAKSEMSEISEQTGFDGYASPRQRVFTKLKNIRLFLCAAVLLAGVLLAGVAYAPILREVASFLIVEDPLQPVAAIVALGGQTPFREMEAAKLYHAGWAPLVVIVREAPNGESEALKQLGINKRPSWELSRAVLIQQGVPAASIVIPKDEAVGTLEELQAVWAVLSQRSEVSGQRSTGGIQETHRTQQTHQTHNTAGGEMHNAQSVIGHPSSVAANNAKNATNAARDNALPVILVTSKYHTRRTALTWKYVTGGKSQAIVRAASRDPFDPGHWWQQRRFVLSVVREYLGLANYYAGFPVAP